MQLPRMCVLGLRMCVRRGAAARVRSLACSRVRFADHDPPALKSPRTKSGSTAARPSRNACSDAGEATVGRTYTFATGRWMADGRRVVIKTPLSTPDARSRISREAAVLLRLQHPALIRPGYRTVVVRLTTE